MNIVELLEVALVYCEAARLPDRNRQRTCHCCPLCELLIREEIQPAIEKALEQAKELPEYW